MEKIGITHNFYCDKCEEHIVGFDDNQHDILEYFKKHSRCFATYYLNQRTYRALLCSSCLNRFRNAIDRTESDEDKLKIIMKYNFQKDFNEKN